MVGKFVTCTGKVLFSRITGKVVDVNGRVLHVRQSNGVIAYIDPAYFVIKECDENGCEKVWSTEEDYDE